MPWSALAYSGFSTMKCRVNKSFPGNSVLGNIRVELAEKTGGLNRSMQRWLGAYQREFQSPKFF